jgi:hypothetical protein
MMSAGFAAEDQISRRLQESLACLRKDIERVELWVDAMKVFSQPIPDYRPRRDHMLAVDNPESHENVDSVKTGKLLASSSSKADSGG